MSLPVRFWEGRDSVHSRHILSLHVQQWVSLTVCPVPRCFLHFGEFSDSHMDTAPRPYISSLDQHRLFPKMVRSGMQSCWDQYHGHLGKNPLMMPSSWCWSLHTHPLGCPALAHPKVSHSLPVNSLFFFICILVAQSWSLRLAVDTAESDMLKNSVCSWYTSSLPSSSYFPQISYFHQ